MYSKSKHIHFVGIGGIGMSGIAELLLNLGYRISGSDLQESDITRRLQALGGTLHIGHDAAWINGADVVVISSAIAADNPEVEAAVNSLIPVIPRAEMLAELMRLTKFGIAIAGSHGKTTTTSMVAWVLAEAGLDPTVVIGGKVDCLGGINAKLGEGDFLIAEADESDGSFLKLAPVLEVVTNIDLEHLDYYSSIEQIKAVFLDFIDKIPFYGAVILCLDDPHVASILPEVKKRFLTYGLTSQANVYAKGINTSGLNTRFEVCVENVVLGEVNLPLAGVHNVFNALAAITVGLELDIPFATIAAALESFSGVQRRLQVKGEWRDITVVDDYGHHPTEIRATLSALRDAWPERRLVVLFQPHRYSRTKALAEEFYTAFHEADILLLTEIYSASESPIPGVTAEALLNGIKKHGHRHAYFEPSFSELLDKAMDILAPGDVVLSLGAGNIWQAGEKLLKMLQD
ncbi:MAG: UDP-N-acetylmuramate--L-alanine ligase [Desulfobulbaceae bacterium]|jgi:UDP-N-acetylmuramate--alanine ligase|nr:UDP-N-acetylmuramate--L-alanine ligase [Desulfobulbaceae bacterium]MDH3781923.1 UDP-N-acetylmuramate--L-alanine ligase [Desulfobulbaceae bacterium]MDH3995317.1 UDP-N-acetylmuramate--L-alanine ligase [Desulfobulbaceae bacterium]HKJ15471.1 UDP-N-acetylmuramate--L-alanine ligase [Desulfobulbales bacterium]